MHVSGGTFLPIREKKIDKHKMHSEYASINENAAKQVRETLRKREESNCCRHNGNEGIREFFFVDKAFRHLMDPLIHLFKPGHDFKVYSGLFTNFHLPKSTLFILVNAFIGIEKAKELYKLAINKRYRLFSYGDCCLLFP